MRYENLVLLALVKISKGSHQIVLGYIETRTQMQAQLSNVFVHVRDHAHYNMKDDGAAESQGDEVCVWHAIAIAFP